MMRLRKISYLKDTKPAVYLISVAMKILLAILVICIVYSGSTQKVIADNVVRLHIVANSNSPEDQELKFKVRDAILEHIRTEYPNGATREETAQYLKNNLPRIEQIAMGVLKDCGSNETVKAKYGVFPFPTKEYEGITLPAGMYEAVRVELGQAEGENWWCVMFPPLCVADANSLKIDEQAMKHLWEELGPDNYRLITDITDRNNIDVKIKFGIIELFQNSRIKIAEIIGHIF